MRREDLRRLAPFAEMAAAPCREAIARDYAAKARGDGSAGRDWSGDVESWGYTPAMLECCDLGANADARALFAAACGGGCPLTLDGVRPRAGETVVDLGCGAGHDLLLAARMVGEGGRVIGVDMTDEMLASARTNIEKFGADGCAVELKRGVIDDGTALEGVVDANVADYAISNGVFNLTLDKLAAFATAYRVLKPGATPPNVSPRSARPSLDSPPRRRPVPPV